MRSAITLIFWLSSAQTGLIFPIPLVASHLPLTMAEIKVLSSLESAKEKLKQNGFPFEDPTWNDVRNDCGLLLPELIALKNEVAGTTPTSVSSISLFVVSRLQQRLPFLRRRYFAQLNPV